MSSKADLCRILYAKRAEIRALVKAGDAGKLAGRPLSATEADAIHGALIFAGLVIDDAEQNMPEGLR